MKLGRVIDEVVSSVRLPPVRGRKILLVQPVGLDRSKPSGEPPLVAVDTCGAGRGQLVLISEDGRAARKALDDPRPPVRTLILGIVDE